MKHHIKGDALETLTHEHSNFINCETFLKVYIFEHKLCFFLNWAFKLNCFLISFPFLNRIFHITTSVRFLGNSLEYTKFYRPIWCFASKLTCFRKFDNYSILFVSGHCSVLSISLFDLVSTIIYIRHFLNVECCWFSVLAISIKFRNAASFSLV